MKILRISILSSLLAVIWPVMAFCENHQGSFEIDINVVNQPPQMSQIPDITIKENASSQPIPITLTDPDNNADELAITVGSNNQTLVPSENIVITGSGANRFVIITPTANEVGALSIKFALNDGRNTTFQTFSVHIIPNISPKISSIFNQNTIQDIATDPIPFTVADADSQKLTLWCESSDDSIVEAMTINGTDANNSILISPGLVYNLSLTVTPAQAAYGNVSITVFVKDATNLKAQTQFSLMITEAQYQIMTTISGPGQITPSNPIVKKYGQVVIRMTPDDDYMVKDVIVDGISKGAMPRYIAYGSNPPNQLTAVFGPPDQYTITTVTNTGGSISPSGPVLVTENKDQLFQISTDYGYVLTDVLVDGVSINPVVLYEFENVNLTHTIQANFREASPPVANFTSNINDGFIPLKIQFADMSSIDDKDGDEITDWLWDFGDGSAKSTSQNPIHYYSTEGNYTVTLTTTSTGGLTDTITKTDFVTVQPSDVYLSFNANQTDISKGDAVQYSVQSNVTSGISWEWDFGDGSTSTDMCPSHTYLDAGKYTVKLTARVSGQDYIKQKVDYIKVGGRTIKGKVTAGDTGDPLQLYWIEVWHSGTSAIAYTSTDENGKYTITGLPPDTGFIVAAYPPENTNDYFQEFYENKSSFVTASTIDLTLQDRNVDFVLTQVPQYGFSGRVHNGTNGLSNVEVIVYSEDANFSARTVSDSQGNYTLTGLKLATDYIINVYYNAADYYYAIPDTETQGNYTPVCGDTALRWDLATACEPTVPVLQHIDLVLCNTGTIHGQVTNSSNQSLQNIWVNAISSELNIENGALTNEQGEYTITGLTIVSDSDRLSKGYLVEIFDSNYPYHAFTELVTANQSQVTFTLKQTASITGQVVDIYNNPIPDVRLTAYSKGSPASKQGTTVSNANGNYTLNSLPFATDYIVAAFSDYFPDQYYNQKTSEDIDQAETISLSSGDVSGINFILDEGAIIKGYVHIKDTPSNLAAQNIWVDIHSISQPDVGAQVMTDSNGYYEMTGLDDNYNDYIIQVKLSGYQPAYYNATAENTTVYLWSEADTIAPSTDTERNLLIVSGFSIKGLVTFDGSPVKDLQVIAYSQNGDNGSTLTTQYNLENFEITGLPNGIYTVFVSSSQYADAELTNIEVNGGDVSNVDFSLALPQRKIQGTIFSLGADKSIKLLVFSIDGDDSKIIEMVGDGNPMPYTIPALQPNADYKMQLYSNDYPDQIYNAQSSINDADIIDLSLANATGIDLTLNTDVAIITGKVTFPSTASQGDRAWVDVQSQSTGSQGAVEVSKLTSTTDPVSDDYTITGLARANDFLVHVWSDKYVTQYYSGKDNETDADRIDTTAAYETGDVNFTLDPGNKILGKIVDEYKQGISNIYVEASSDSANAIRGTMSEYDGNFTVMGLKPADDYKLKAVKHGIDVPFFYHVDQTVRDRTLASTISTLTGDFTGIEMILSEGLSIAGTVRDDSRNPILNEKIWVNISSEASQINVGDYISNDGTYQISGLPSGQDYQVDAQPISSSPYLAGTITNIESGQDNVDFYLSKGKKISGTVQNSSGDAIRNVRVNISSVSQSVGKWVKTGSDGSYEIDGLPDASDYAIIATPPENSDYVEFSEFGLVIDNDITKDIKLLPAMQFTGYVYLASDVTPLKNAWVSAFSQSSDNFMKGVRTDSEGRFEINNVPDASDYVIEVQADDYLSQKLENQSPGVSNINFYLVESGTISGSVKTINGQPISGARVTATSDSVNNVVVVVTGSNGKYELDGLNKTDTYGYTITNYKITVEAEGYQAETKVQKAVGDVVDFQLSTGGSISGTIRDTNGNTPPQEYKITISIFEKLDTGRPKLPPIRTSADSDGQFSVQGLSSGVSYLIQVKSNITGTLENKIQWVGDSHLGVLKYNGTATDGGSGGPAIEISPGDVVDFKFRGTF